MLNLYRRHTSKCPHGAKGQDYTKCPCPIWCYGQSEARTQIRESLHTRDWQRAIRRAAALESPDAQKCKPINEAIIGFQQHILSLEASTQRKYSNVLRQLAKYCDRMKLTDLSEITVEWLDGYRSSRSLSRTTAQKELETLRQFMTYCRDRDWIKDNPARSIGPTVRDSERARLPGFVANDNVCNNPLMSTWYSIRSVTQTASYRRQDYCGA